MFCNVMLLFRKEIVRLILTKLMVSCSFTAQDSDEQTFVTESDSSLLPAVIALAVLAIFLIAVSSVATYCYCAVKKASE